MNEINAFFLTKTKFSKIGYKQEHFEKLYISSFKNEKSEQLKKTESIYIKRKQNVKQCKTTNFS